MKWFKRFLFCTLLVIAQSGQAAHLVGGEFQMHYKGNFTYEVQLTVYGDNSTLSAGNQDAYVDVSIFVRGTNQFVETFRMPIGATSFVPYVNQQCQSGSVQTKILPYKLTRSFDPQTFSHPNGYYMVWERCCRNQGIINIQSPGAAGFVYYAEFPPVTRNGQLFVNSSPVLPPMPPDVLCLQELYQYSMQATDADGDQLVYKLSTPLNGFTNSTTPVTQGRPGPYPPISWRPPFNLNNQISGSQALTINSATGLIMVRPNLNGLFVFGITVEEYRNGVKIGEIRRDIQVKVVTCITNNKPTISLRPPGATRDYQPGDTLLVTDATDYCYDLKFSDPDLGQQVTIKVEPLNFSQAPVVTPASGTINQAGQVLNARICWADCNVNSPNQLYKVNLIVTDNPCGKSSSDTLELSFLVVPKPNARPQVSTMGLGNNEMTAIIGKPLTFNLLSTDADKDQMSLRMSGEGFIPANEGMSLNPATGTEAFQSTFTWVPNCEQQGRKEFYDLNFIVKDNSCFPNHTDTVSVRIRVKEVIEETVFLPPNIFTPNDDGKNDLFITPTLPPDKCDDTFQEIRIFNRWGRLVYKSADRQFAWDGKKVSDGVYYYTIRFQKRNFKGHITIVR